MGKIIQFDFWLIWMLTNINNNKENNNKLKSPQFYKEVSFLYSFPKQAFPFQFLRLSSRVADVDYSGNE